MSSLCTNSSPVSAKGDGGVMAGTDTRIVLLRLKEAISKSFTRNPIFSWTDGPVSSERTVVQLLPEGKHRTFSFSGQRGWERTGGWQEQLLWKWSSNKSPCFLHLHPALISAFVEETPESFRRFYWEAVLCICGKTRDFILLHFHYSVTHSPPLDFYRGSFSTVLATVDPTPDLSLFLI